MQKIVRVALFLISALLLPVLPASVAESPAISVHKSSPAAQMQAPGLHLDTDSSNRLGKLTFLEAGVQDSGIRSNSGMDRSYLQALDFFFASNLMGLAHPDSMVLNGEAAKTVLPEERIYFCNTVQRIT